MSLNKGATSRRTWAVALLAGAAMGLALAPAQALAQQKQVTFPTAGAFVNLTTTAGADTVTIAADNALYLPVITTGTSPAVAQDTYTKDFLGGVNTITNNGYVMVGTERGAYLNQTTGVRSGDNKRYEAEMRIVNLTTFNNNGSIYLGNFYYSDNTQNFLMGTDIWYDDILSMEGADFVGGTNSRVFLDANLNLVGQSGCGAALRASDGTLPANDCINLANGSASGRTLVTIVEIVPGDRGAYNPEGNVIVDLTGGDPDDTNPNAFVVDPGSEGYDARTGVIDKGLFAYTIAYDPEAQQFKLYGVQSAASRQLPLLAHAANDLWRTSAGGWFDRQVGRREGDGDGLGGGFWARVTTSTADRGVTATGAAGAATLTFDNSYRQEDTAVTFGVDLISGDGGDGFVVGAMIGYARSRVDFNDYDNTANLEGMQGGVYGGFTSGPFFVDAALNGTWLDLDSDVPALDLTPAGTKLGSKISSLGGRIEAGWRFGSDRFGLEPLAGVTYVRTAFDDINVPADDPSRLGGGVTYDDATSLRAGVGLRFSIDDVVPMTRISLTARQSNEFEGDAAVSIANIGPTAATAEDTFDGQFSELSAAVTVANPSRTASGYVSLGAAFGEDYDSVGVSAGLRFQW